MNSQASKVKVYRSSALILSAAAFALYLLSYLTANDQTDYFVSGHPLPMLANALTLASIVWFASAFVLIPKGALPEGNFMQGKPCIPAVLPIIGTLGAGALGTTYFSPDDIAALLAREKPLGTTAICAVLVALGVILSVAYYVLTAVNASGTESTRVIMGVGPMALMTGLCGLTYFEQDHHMNAPAKVALQLAFIATMVFLTAELRCTLNRAQPRRYLATASVALLANACAIPGAIRVLISPETAVHGTRILGFSLLCLCNGIYIACRLSAFSKYCNSAAPEQSQEKEQDDGCQQQDPMATQENN